MARAYAACLGCIALLICIFRGLLIGDLPDEILGRAIGMLVVFTSLGFGLGWAAETVIRQSVEVNFRRAMQKLQEKQTQ